MSPDDIRRLDADRAILVPERQNPLLVRRIVYFEDPVFNAIHEAQSGPLPVSDIAFSQRGAEFRGRQRLRTQPAKADPEVAVLRREVAELREAVKGQGGAFAYKADVVGAAEGLAAEVVENEKVGPPYTETGLVDGGQSSTALPAELTTRIGQLVSEIDRQIEGV